MDITQATAPEQRADCFHAHMRAVAAALSGFVYKPIINEESRGWQAAGELISGQERTSLHVTLHLGDYKNANPYRAECFGTYPRTAKGERYPNYGTPAPSIKFQLTRPAAQIAGDIQRRLLPEYRVYFDRVAHWVSKSDQAAATLDATRAEMQAVGFSFPDHMPNEGQMLFARGEKLSYARPYVYVYGGHVDLKLKNLSPERARAVLEVLDLLPEPRYV